jgi:hypothetical protein
MAELNDDPQATLGRLTSRSRVLLINPPVEERRYNWLRWNQPLDLLQLSSWLKRKSSGMEVRLYDFMFPSETGEVEKKLVKDGTQQGLRHFGTSHEDFSSWFTHLIGREGWCPTCIIITSLTSYWYGSIEKLLNNIFQTLGPKHRKKVQICLYGAYPRLEPEHAECQWADIAFTCSVDTLGCAPDHELYLKSPHNRLPQFAALDIRDDHVHEHAEALFDLKVRSAKKSGNDRAQALTIAFFNDDVGVEVDGLRRMATLVDANSRSQFILHGICGIRAQSLSTDTLDLMSSAGFRTLYVEHERAPGGALDRERYSHVYDAYQRCRQAHRRGQENAWLARDGVTGFVNVGLPDDNMDLIVKTTLELNEMFGSVIIKPWGWSPEVGPAKRSENWDDPKQASPQWYPYANGTSQLATDDYRNLMRWQSILNTRVKGMTFDFLDDGKVAKLVRETVVSESWKRHVL